MKQFQAEIDEAKRLACLRGFGRLTFGWKEWDGNAGPASRAGTVSVTSLSPSMSVTYHSGDRSTWLESFDADLRSGRFHVTTT